MINTIEEWLQNLGLAKYAAVLEQNDVGFDVLPALTEAHLTELGVSLGDRLRLLKAVELLAADQVTDVLADPPAQAVSLSPQQDTHAEVPFREGERRQLTVMFCDLVGSTELSTRLDPEDLQDVLRSYHEFCAKSVAQYGGYVAKYMGDGVLIYFGYPQAHENDAESAVRAGCEILTSVPAIDLAVGDLRLAVHIGINTGPVVVGDIIGEGAAQEANVVGEELPNVAARLQALAGPNQMVVGPLTKDLVSERFGWEDLGPQNLKGIVKPVRAWRGLPGLAAARQSESRRTVHSSPVVGRREEIGLLARAWEESKTGQGQVVLIQGDAGLGKSRLVEALRDRVSDEKHVWIAARCSPYHSNTTLYPIIEQLQRAAGWKPQDDSRSKLTKLETLLAAQPLSPEEAVPLFAELLALQLPQDRYAPLRLDPAEYREKILDALVGWLMAEAERQPVLQVWEDLHWAIPRHLNFCNCASPSPQRWQCSTWSPIDPTSRPLGRCART